LRFYCLLFTYLLLTADFAEVRKCGSELCRRNYTRGYMFKKIMKSQYFTVNHDFSSRDAVAKRGICYDTSLCCLCFCLSVCYSLYGSGN